MFVICWHEIFHLIEYTCILYKSLQSKWKNISNGGIQQKDLVSLQLNILWPSHHSVPVSIWFQLIPNRKKKFGPWQQLLGKAVFLFFLSLLSSWHRFAYTYQLPVLIFLKKGFQINVNELHVVLELQITHFCSGKIIKKHTQ